MNDTFDQFDVVLQLLGGNMQHEVVKVIKPFLDLKKSLILIKCIIYHL